MATDDWLGDLDLAGMPVGVSARIKMRRLIIWTHWIN